MKAKRKISGYMVRSAAVAVLFTCAIVGFSSAFNSSSRIVSSSGPSALAGSGVKPATQTKTLTFPDRVAYQRAIEEVYWRHRIWPKENAKPKPSLNAVMSRAQIEKKVEDYLRNSQLLADYWQQPITPEQLQAEMERMAQHTKQPEVLRELFDALGNDPFVVAECLARAALAERLVTTLYAHDQRFHGELKRRAEAKLRTHRGVKQMKQTSGTYTEIEWVKSSDEKRTVRQAHRSPKEDASGGTPALQEQDAPNAVKLNSTEWNERVQKLAGSFGVRRRVAAFESADMSAHSKNADSYETIPVGKLSPLQENDVGYYATTVIHKGKNQLKLAAITWLKEPLRSWLAKAQAQVATTMAAVSASYALPAISSPSVACTDTWTATSITNAPDARSYHTAVWTGSEMIVWGGGNNTGPLNTGARYDPSTDTWAATSLINAPAARNELTAVWTGTEMIVWGGTRSSDGGRYNPGTDTWVATSLINVPAFRSGHTAVWTGTEMIVWGGVTGSYPNYIYTNTGGRYDPSTDSWIPTSITNVPTGRYAHTAVWTGSKMVVWGGSYYDGSEHYLNTGGQYDPGTDSWIATSTSNAPAARQFHTAVWTGSEMIIWGSVSDSSGGRYNPSTNSWTATSTTNAPAARGDDTAIWTGSEMIVWGGIDESGNYLNTGGRYNPGADSWTATSTSSAPGVRRFHTAVWTGSQMIVWGGELIFNGSYYYLNTGGRYCAQSPHPPFFTGEVALGNGIYYLQFPNGNVFGYYAYLTDPHFIYHFDMGYEYWFDANDGHSGIFFYDFASNHFFYTSPSFAFPYLYDFSLNTILYYYPDPNNPGHYTTNPRYFYDFATGHIITM